MAGKPVLSTFPASSLSQSKDPYIRESAAKGVSDNIRGEGPIPLIYKGESGRSPQGDGHAGMILSFIEYGE